MRALRAKAREPATDGTYWTLGAFDDNANDHTIPHRTVPYRTVPRHTARVSIPQRHEFRGVVWCGVA
eukprot:4387118-Lingulodinium_polyedra.AAC.1